ncbi:hypothetical protein SAMN05428967_4485 [Phyllobacterium sp. YR620]|uniref:hypothetical protein n=1 Tax=Phyllobacterium sp. YR620 TaxID=1881066 RepID=UPI000884B716|nr:hypothetical protein [Phyllobacterium sp. YR620]SDP92601.1 hypothetical protein SAMN05428967_4485 [Phyllobacterium sp. YR620]
MNGAPGAVDAVVNLLIGLGLPGVIIIALGFAVYRLYNRNQELLDTMVETGRETVKAQEAATASINRLSDLLLRGKAPE